MFTIRYWCDLPDGGLVLCGKVGHRFYACHFAPSEADLIPNNTPTRLRVCAHQWDPEDPVRWFEVTVSAHSTMHAATLRALQIEGCELMICDVDDARFDYSEYVLPLVWQAGVGLVNALHSLSMHATEPVLESGGCSFGGRFGRDYDGAPEYYHVSVVPVSTDEAVEALQDNHEGRMVVFAAGRYYRIAVVIGSLGGVESACGHRVTAHSRRDDPFAGAGLPDVVRALAFGMVDAVL